MVRDLPLHRITSNREKPQSTGRMTSDSTALRQKPRRRPVGCEWSVQGKGRLSVWAMLAHTTIACFTTCAGLWHLRRVTKQIRHCTNSKKTATNCQPAALELWGLQASPERTSWSRDCAKICENEIKHHRTVY